MSAGLAEVFPAGEYLAEELEERGWTQAEFAEILGRPPQFVSEIISGKKRSPGSRLPRSAPHWAPVPSYGSSCKTATFCGAKGKMKTLKSNLMMSDCAPV